MWLPATSSTRLWTDVGLRASHYSTELHLDQSWQRCRHEKGSVTRHIGMTHDLSVFAIKYWMLWLWKPHFQILSTLHKARHIMPITLKHTWQEVSAAVAGIQAIAGRQSSNLPERSSYARHFSEFQLGLGALLITPGSCSYILASLPLGPCCIS